VAERERLGRGSPDRSLSEIPFPCPPSRQRRARAANCAEITSAPTFNPSITAERVTEAVERQFTKPRQSRLLPLLAAPKPRAANPTPSNTSAKSCGAAAVYGAEEILIANRPERRKAGPADAGNHDRRNRLIACSAPASFVLVDDHPPVLPDPRRLKRRHSANPGHDLLLILPIDSRRAGQAPSRQEREESPGTGEPGMEKEKRLARAHLNPPLSEIPSMLRSASRRQTAAAGPSRCSCRKPPPDKVSGLFSCRDPARAAARARPRPRQAAAPGVPRWEGRLRRHRRGQGRGVWKGRLRGARGGAGFLFSAQIRWRHGAPARALPMRLLAMPQRRWPRRAAVADAAGPRKSQQLQQFSTPITLGFRRRRGRLPRQPADLVLETLRRKRCPPGDPSPKLARARLCLERVSAETACAEGACLGPPSFCPGDVAVSPGNNAEQIHEPSRSGDPPEAWC